MLANTRLTWKSFHVQTLEPSIPTDSQGTGSENLFLNISPQRILIQQIFFPWQSGPVFFSLSNKTKEWHNDPSPPTPNIAFIPSLLTGSFLFIREKTSKACFSLYFWPNCISSRYVLMVKVFNHCSNFTVRCLYFYFLLEKPCPSCLSSQAFWYPFWIIFISVVSTL